MEPALVCSKPAAFDGNASHGKGRALLLPVALALAGRALDLRCIRQDLQGAPKEALYSPYQGGDGPL